MSAGDDVRKAIDLSPATTMSGNVAAALRIVAERLDKADETDRHEHEMRDGLLSIINAQTDKIRALEERVAALEPPNVDFVVHPSHQLRPRPSGGTR